MHLHLLLALLTMLYSPADEYYVVIMAYQERAARLEPAETHTFADWVCVRENKIVDEVVINWGPKEDSARIATATVEGKHFTLKESFDHIAKENKNFRYWVLKSDKNMMDAARAQRDSLKEYKVFDRRTRPSAVNCIHAISDVVGHLDTRTACGIEAGERIVRFFLEKRKAQPTDNTKIATLIFEKHDSPVK